MALEIFDRIIGLHALSKKRKDDPKLLKLLDIMFKLAEGFEKMAINIADMDPAKSFKCYDVAIKLYDRVRSFGNVDALYQLAQCYENSRALQNDVAIEFYEQASKKDHIGAMFRLCQIYLENPYAVSASKILYLANKMYESAQFYEQIQGSNKLEQAHTLYEHAAKLRHIGTTKKGDTNIMKLIEPVLPSVGVESGPKDAVERNLKSQPGNSAGQEDQVATISSNQERKVMSRAKTETFFRAANYCSTALLLKNDLVSCMLKPA